PETLSKNVVTFSCWLSLESTSTLEKMLSVLKKQLGVEVKGTVNEIVYVPVPATWLTVKPLPVGTPLSVTVPCINVGIAAGEASVMEDSPTRQADGESTIRNMPFVRSTHPVMVLSVANAEGHSAAPNANPTIHAVTMGFALIIRPTVIKNRILLV